jgi:hypothetical protein
MLYAVHHVSGRLRIKNLRIKDSPREAEAFCSELRSIRGVCSAVANVVTCSVVIRYDPAIASPNEIFNAMKGAIKPPVLEWNAIESGGAGLSRIANRIVHLVVQLIFERLVERSAMALLTALI